MKQSIEALTARYIAMRYRSEGEVRAYLAKKAKAFSLKEEDIEKLVSKFIDLGFIDDEKYAQAVVHHYLSRGKGQAFIKMKLSQAGVDKAIIANLIGSFDEANLQEAMEKRLKRFEKKWEGLSKFERGRKAYGVLFSSGFASKDIRPFIDVWLQRGYNTNETLNF